MKYFVLIVILFASIKSYAYELPINYFEDENLKEMTSVNFDFGPAIVVNKKFYSRLQTSVILFLLAREYGHIANGTKSYYGNKYFGSIKETEAMADCYAAKSYANSDGIGIKEVIAYYENLNESPGAADYSPKERASIIQACIQDDLEGKYKFLSRVKSRRLVEEIDNAYKNISLVTSGYSDSHDIGMIKSDYILDEAELNDKKIINYKTSFDMVGFDKCSYSETIKHEKNYKNITYSCEIQSSDHERLSSLYDVYSGVIGTYFPNLEWKNWSDHKEQNAKYNHYDYGSSAYISFKDIGMNNYQLTVSFTNKLSLLGTELSYDDLCYNLDILFKKIDGKDLSKLDNDVLTCNQDRKAYKCRFKEDVSFVNGEETRLKIKNLLKYRYGAKVETTNKKEHTYIAYYGGLRIDIWRGPKVFSPEVENVGITINGDSSETIQYVEGLPLAH